MLSEELGLQKLLKGGEGWMLHSSSERRLALCKYGSPDYSHL